CVSSVYYLNVLCPPGPTLFPYTTLFRSLYQWVAGFDGAPGVEEDLRNASANLGIYCYLMDGGYRADAAGEAGDRFYLDVGGADLRGRRLVVCEIGRDGLLAKPVETV